MIASEKEEESTHATLSPIAAVLSGGAQVSVSAPYMPGITVTISVAPSFTCNRVLKRGGRQAV